MLYLTCGQLAVWIIAPSLYVFLVVEALFLISLPGSALI